jgi:SAM-dependent methyltransferase
MTEDTEKTRKLVREAYAEIGKQGGSCCSAEAACCGTSEATRVAMDVGYSEAELATLPDGANLGLSCGNPTAIASLEGGDVVLDLGSGGGFDVFIAAQKVGASGRVIGVDMTPEMIERARENAASFQKRTLLANVEFRLGEIEHIPAADSSVDVVISNCVINLSPDKPQVWREVLRILKPGGRVAVSDLALLRPLPEVVRTNAAALVGCVAGAQLVDDIRNLLDDTGFVDVELTPKSEYADKREDWTEERHRAVLEGLPQGATLADFVVSLDISARKPSD